MLFRSAGEENGNFVLQALGREIMNAGFYPANFPPEISDVTQQGMYDTYPPLESKPRKTTDWQNSDASWPPVAYMTGIFGCEGATFNVATGTCPSPTVGASDSIVVNYFTSDPDAEFGTRRDCTGSLVDNDPSNVNRFSASASKNTPPLLPLFVSNRFSLNDLKNFVDRNDVTTRSFTCSGNGSNPHGVNNSYQPIVTGIRELKFKYGVFADANTLTPQRFYTAGEVNALPTIEILGQTYTGWQRVTSVKVCVLSQSQGGGVRLEDKADDRMTYEDCSDSTQTQPAGQWINRFVQVFGVRNGLKQSY